MNVVTCCLNCPEMLDSFVSNLPKLTFSKETQFSISIVIVILSFIVISYCRMDLMRFIQECKVPGQNNKPDTKEKKLRENYKYKDFHIKNLELRLQELEKEVSELEIRNQDSIVEKSEIMTMLRQYEELISKITSDNEHLLCEKIVLQEHMNNMECSFKELLEKYEKAKTIIDGLKENEKDLYKQREKYESIIKIIEQRNEAAFRSCRNKKNQPDVSKMAKTHETLWNKREHKNISRKYSGT